MSVQPVLLDVQNLVFYGCTLTCNADINVVLLCTMVREEKFEKLKCCKCCFNVCIVFLLWCKLKNGEVQSVWRMSNYILSVHHYKNCCMWYKTWVYNSKLSDVHVLGPCIYADLNRGHACIRYFFGGVHPFL